MVVAKATIRTSAWDTLYNFLQTGTYAISTNNIYSSLNSKLVQDVGYPFVIIETPSTSNTKMTINRDGITKREIVFNILIYHTSSATCKALADEIENKMHTGFETLQLNGLCNMEIDGSDNDSYPDGDKGMIHVIVLPVRFYYIADGI